MHAYSLFNVYANYEPWYQLKSYPTKVLPTYLLCWSTFCIVPDGNSGAKVPPQPGRTRRQLSIVAKQSDVTLVGSQENLTIVRLRNTIGDARVKSYTRVKPFVAGQVSQGNASGRRKQIHMKIQVTSPHAVLQSRIALGMSENCRNLGE